MKKINVLLILTLSVFSFFTAGCEYVEESDKLVKDKEEESFDNEYNMRALSPYEFKETDDSNKGGLYWFKNDKGLLYDNNKPILILVHGGVRYLTIKNRTNSNFKNWNGACFNWTRPEDAFFNGDISEVDFNSPPFVYSFGSEDMLGLYAEGYTGHAQNLFNHLRHVIEDKSFNNNEIRLMGNSWGTHVVSYTAKKLLKYINQRKLNILVTVDLTEPVVSWPVSITDDEGNTRRAPEHVRENLKYVATHQRVKMISGRKLFTVIGAKNYASGALGPEFLKQVLIDNDIKKNTNAYIEKDSDSHQDPRDNYMNNRKLGNGTRCSDKRILIKNGKAVPGFERGSEKIKLINVESTGYDGNVFSWGHGPIIYSEWAYLPHTCYKWVDVKKSATGWRWEDVKHTCWQCGGWKRKKHKGWWGTYYTYEWEAKKNVIHCNEKFAPHQEWKPYTYHYYVKEYWNHGTKENCGDPTHKKYTHKVWNFFSHDKRI